MSNSGRDGSNSSYSTSSSSSDSDSSNDSSDSSSSGGDAEQKAVIPQPPTNVTRLAQPTTPGKMPPQVLAGGATLAGKIPAGALSLGGGKMPGKILMPTPAHKGVPPPAHKGVPTPAATATSPPSTSSVAPPTATAVVSGAIAPFLNPQLVYQHPDSSPIPVPQSTAPYGGSLIAMMDLDRGVFPPRKYRYVDYLVVAMDMFLAEVLSEHKRQSDADAKKKKDTPTKFTWANKGELAICFALTCDMLKLLHDNLSALGAGGSGKPKWDVLVENLIQYLVRKSQIPTDVLTDKTYDNKYKDWVKGGTRYNKEGHANVRFPSAEERLKKLETRIQSGASYEVQSTVIEAPQPLNTSSMTTHSSAGGASSSSTSTTTRGSERLSGEVAVGASQPPAGPGPITQRTKAPPTGTAAFKQPQENRSGLWQSELNAIKGSANLLLLPRDRLDKLPQLINLSYRCETPDQYLTITHLINQSPLDVQVAFEEQGGLVLVKRWLWNCLRIKKEAAVRTLAELTASMQLASWSPRTRAAWHNGCVNLDWLRAAEFLGMRPQLWHETVTRLEALARTPSSSNNTGTSDHDEASSTYTRVAQKRPRADDANTITQNIVTSAPAMTTVPLTLDNIRGDRAVHLSDDLALLLPAGTNYLEASSINALLERRRHYQLERQRAMEERIRQALEARNLKDGTSLSMESVTIPIWSNPFSLLGVPTPEYMSVL